MKQCHDMEETLADGKRGKPKQPPVIYQGEEVHLPSLCKQNNKSPKHVKKLIDQGMTIEDAIALPKQTGYQSNSLAVGIHGGIRTKTTKTLFEIFNTYGQAAFEEAIKNEVEDPKKVLSFFKTYIMPLLPRDAMQVLDGDKSVKPNSSLHINIDKAYMPTNLNNLEPL